MITIILAVIALWWALGIIATTMLLRRGRIVLADYPFLCVLSIFPGPLAFAELTRY
jgi:hypothetical protein